MIRKISILILLIFIAAECYPQEEIVAEEVLIDSLSRASPLNDSRTVEWLEEQVALRLGLMSPDDDFSRIFIPVGEFYARGYQYDSAVSNFERALTYIQNLDDSARIAEIYYKLGGAYSDIEDYPNSTELLLKAADIQKQLGNERDYARSLLAIANNYYYFGDFKIGIDYYRQAHKLFSQLGDTLYISRALGNSAALHTYEEYFDTAKILYQKAFDQVKYTDYTEQIIDILIGLGILYEELEEYDKSYRYYYRAFLEAKRIGDVSQEAFCYQNFAFHFLMTDKLDSAEYFARKSLEYSDIINSNLLKSNSYELLRQINEKKKNYALAYEYLQKVKDRNDSLYDLNSRRQLEVINARYKLREQESDLEQSRLKLQLQENDLNRQIVIRNALVAVLFLLVLLISLVYRSQRVRKQANDLLKLKNAEIQRKSREIVQMEEAKSRWFVNISHELRTPLTLIKGPIEQLAARSDVDAGMKKSLQISRRNVRQLENLVNEILDVSRMEQGEVKLDIQPVDMLSLVEDVIHSFEPAANLANIKLDFSSPLERPFIVKLDKPKIQKVVTNLLSNAIKYTSEEGEVNVKLIENAESVILEVQDTGDGIATEDLPYIFDRFYQARNRDKSNLAGSGIGLSLSKEIALLHDGDIKLVCEQGKGCVFSLILPGELRQNALSIEEKSETLDSGPAEADNFTRTNKTILIVEDNLDMREYIDSILSQYYNVWQAKDGKEALSLLESNKPDLIISDIMMPRMDGMTFAKAVKESQSNRGIPFIILTALSEDRIRVENLRLGVDDYLLKPFNPEELLIRIQNLIMNAKERISSEEEGLEIVSYDEKLLKKLQLEVLENIGNPEFNVADLANLMDFSERQLYRYVKQKTGLTPANFVKEIRLQKAMELASKRVYATAAELASAVGFAHSSYFISVFKKRFGKSPSSYLKG